MERVIDAIEPVEVFENEIEMYLSQFCEENNIEDFTKESQNRWSAALIYIYKHVFKGTNKLKSKVNITDSNSPIISTFNAYDYKILNNICDYYIYLCLIHDKEVSINGFTFLTGINPDTIYEWKNEETKLSKLSTDIYKKLNKYREESLVGKLTAMKHPTAIAILLNKHYGYNLPGVSKEQSNKQALTAAELPKLSDIPTQFTEIEEKKGD